MGIRIWGVIVLTVAVLGLGWALKHQIGVAGNLRAQLQQQKEATTAANAQVARMEAENARQNQLIIEVTNERDTARKTAQKIRTVVRTVMGASADPCVTAPVPDDVARSARAALDELWQPSAAAGKGGGTTPAAGTDARLPATGG